MEDWEKTKEQLIAELQEMRSQLAGCKLASNCSELLANQELEENFNGADNGSSTQTNLRATKRKRRRNRAAPNASLVLIVEDDPDMNFLLAKTLAEDYRIVTAFDGQEGLELAIELRPDLILSDAMMPRMRGDRLIHEIRQRQEFDLIPIVILTGTTDNSLQTQMLRSGAQDYLTKPFSIEELRARVANLIQMKNAREILQEELASQNQDLAALAREVILHKNLLQRSLEALQESEHQYRTLARNFPNGAVCLFDSDLRYLIAEGTGITIPSQDSEDLEGKTIREILPPETCNTLEPMYLAALAGESMVREVTAGEQIFEVHALPVKNDAGEIFAGMVMTQDITAIKLSEQQLRQQAKDLAKVNQMKDEFLAIVSHELRTPLNSILGWAQLLQNRKFDEATVSKGMQTIERNTKYQIKLVDDIIDGSKILQGDFPLHLRSVDPLLVLYGARDLVRELVESKQLKLNLIAQSVEGKIWGDFDRLQQAVWNLLANAVKFTPEGGQIELRLDKKDQWVQIQVIDNGQGISPEFLPYIFERFRQSDSSITRENGGLGLGLTIARHLIAMHGGKIDVTSPGLGKGTSFTVMLPLSPKIE